MPVISRPLVIFGIGLLYIQFLFIPAFAQSVEHYDGYDVISYDNGSKDIISGALNFVRWDGVWRPNDELNISNGSWPYLYSENATTADFEVDDTTLRLPKEKTKFKLRPYSVSYDLTFPKSELQGKETSINLTSAYINIPYDLTSRKPKNRYKDKHNIKFGRFHLIAGMEDIAIHDDTLRNYTEGGKIIQDVTYLFPGEYNYGIDNNGQIRLELRKEALTKLKGNITIEIRTWDITGPNNWGGNVTFSQATDVKATGNVELKQNVTDYALYTRFDEGSGTIIYNENSSNVLTGDLLGVVGTDTWTAGKYGQAIHFDGVKNKVLFNDHPDFRLPRDFTISFYIMLSSDVDNQDTDITRKGSTATADPDQWWKVEIKSNIMQGIVFNNETNEIAEKDTVDRRDGLWHFVVYNREGNTCSLIVDDSTVASRTDCATNISNTAQLAIGAKDTESSGTGMDYTNGTIDEVRFFDRKLSSTDLTSIKNNEHVPAGSVTRNLSSLIHAGEELNESGCNGTWDSSITKVDVMASTNNVNWDMIQSNATPNAIYSIDTGNNYTYLRCSLSTIDSSRTPVIESIRARIIPKGFFYTISVSTFPSYLSPQPTGGDEYTPGQNATVTAQPVSGYTFQNWTENASQVSTSPAYQFTVTGDRNLVAEYTQNPLYTISLSTSPSGLIPQPTGAGQYPSGENATVTAQSVSGYTFQNWTENASLVSTNPGYQFTVTGDRNLVAEYTQNTGSLVGWWKFDNDILDWSGNRNNKACSGSGCPTPTTGKVAGALYFDGNDSIDSGNGASLNITDSITIEAWVKPAQLATQYIVKKASKGSTNGYELSLAADGKAFFRVNQKTSVELYRVDTVSNYPVNNTTWVHLVGLYNGTQIQIYLNGNLEYSKPGPSNISSNTDNLEIGGPDGLAYFKGSIDEVRIWNRALTPQEIEASYKAVPPFLNSINVTPNPITLVAGETRTFTASPKDQYEDPISVSVAWSSSNETVGSVDPITGDFNALAAGTTMVNATNGSVTGTAIVTVKTKTLTPSITILSPNGLENWVRGTIQTIRWNYTGNPGNYVKIELLKPGVTNKVIITRTINDGSHPWLIPDKQAPGTDYKVKITSTTNTSNNDTSNNNFTILAPSFTVVSPNGSENWVRSTTQTIRWNYTGNPGKYVKIELLKPGVANKVIIARTLNDGSHPWFILDKQAPGTDYKVKITSTTNTAYNDTSNNSFTISR